MYVLFYLTLEDLLTKLSFKINILKLHSIKTNNFSYRLNILSRCCRIVYNCHLGGFRAELCHRCSSVSKTIFVFKLIMLFIA